jgi:hypothetical protein
MCLALGMCKGIAAESDWTIVFRPVFACLETGLLWLRDRSHFAHSESASASSFGVGKPVGSICWTSIDCVRPNRRAIAIAHPLKIPRDALFPRFARPKSRHEIWRASVLCNFKVMRRVRGSGPRCHISNDDGLTERRSTHATSEIVCASPKSLLMPAQWRSRKGTK